MYVGPPLLPTRCARWGRAMVVTSSYSTLQPSVIPHQQRVTVHFGAKFSGPGHALIIAPPRDMRHLNAQLLMIAILGPLHLVH